MLLTLSKKIHRQNTQIYISHHIVAYVARNNSVFIEQTKLRT